MAASFYFYDLETSGFNPRSARIMQFAGQRTSLELEPIGQPDNYLIKLTPDVLPDTSAILVTGITPQQTIADGISEAEFLEKFFDDISSDTIFVGYNSVRFDDEFMRYLMWRNFYDPYEWQWQHGCSRWDLLDVVRMTRALRPEGITWPMDAEGRLANRLEMLTAANKIEHAQAHDALADVNATIAVAKLIKTKQPKLFDYLLKYRDKKTVGELANSGQSFVYTSGKYPSEFQKTTVVTKLADAGSGVLVYDLRQDPTDFINLNPKELVERWAYTKDEKAPPRLPVKTLKFNRCPAVAPLVVLDLASQKRLSLDLKTIETNKKKLAVASDFAKKVVEALKLLDKARDKGWFGQKSNAEGRLYDGFISDNDKLKLAKAREASEKPDFADKRLTEIWPRYRARNYPEKLTAEERAEWEKYCLVMLTAGKEINEMAQYFKELAALGTTNPTKKQQFLLEELKLYGESLVTLDI
ncbi:MAG: exodeoxyribonuclease I [Candidatus Saccharimonadales bacterium]